MHGHWLKGYLRDGKEIEGGGGGDSGGPLIVTLSGEQMTADKTYQEIYDAVASGRGAVVIDPEELDMMPSEARAHPVLRVYLAGPGSLGCICAYLNIEWSGTYFQVKSDVNNGRPDAYPKFAQGVG